VGVAGSNPVVRSRSLGVFDRPFPSRVTLRELAAGERLPDWETFDRNCKLFGWPPDVRGLELIDLVISAAT
jgi:hypothetical protein